MSDDVVLTALDARYQRSFGRAAGYLPKDRSAVDAWLSDLALRVEDHKEPFSDAVKALEELIRRNGTVRQYVTEMIEQVPPPHRKGIENIPDLLRRLNYIQGMAPEYNRDPAKRIFFPMSALFVYMMMTKAGVHAFRNREFNAALAKILEAWCTYLDSPASCSVLNTGEKGWLSQPAYEQNKLYEFVIPDRKAEHWGFTSFNAYFHRQIKDTEFRPVSDPADPKTIVSPNDGTVYRYTEQPIASDSDRFWLKAQPYSLADMLNDSEHTGLFVGGHAFQSFLSGADYHRWRSPVDGVVKHVERVPGLMFSEVVFPDETAGTYSQGYQTAVNTRGLVFIESQFGMVCVMPIGITEISSVRFTKDLLNKQVKKGDELGHFSYGGSSMCVLFQKGMIDHFTVPNNDAEKTPDGGGAIYVNAQIARAK